MNKLVSYIYSHIIFLQSFSYISAYVYVTSACAFSSTYIIKYTLFSSGGKEFICVLISFRAFPFLPLQHS